MKATKGLHRDDALAWTVEEYDATTDANIASRSRTSGGEVKPTLSPTDYRSAFESGDEPDVAALCDLTGRLMRYRPDAREEELEKFAVPHTKRHAWLLSPGALRVALQHAKADRHDLIVCSIRGDDPKWI
jgi:hypothetical protein